MKDFFFKTKLGRTLLAAGVAAVGVLVAAYCGACGPAWLVIKSALTPPAETMTVE